MNISEKMQNNERLEFLGDAVLELVSSDVLFKRYPEKLEGTLSKTRASLVCEPALAYCARELGLGDFLQLGRGEDMTGGRERDSILSDALEAVIGSLYLDGGLESARRFIMNFVLNDMEIPVFFMTARRRFRRTYRVGLRIRRFTSWWMNSGRNIIGHLSCRSVLGTGFSAREADAQSRLPDRMLPMSLY